jgi:hypothetical protein
MVSRSVFAKRQTRHYPGIRLKVVKKQENSGIQGQRVNAVRVCSVLESVETRFWGRMFVHRDNFTYRPIGMFILPKKYRQ